MGCDPARARPERRTFDPANDVHSVMFNRWNYGYAHELSSCFDPSLYGPWADQPHRKGCVPFRNVAIACSDSEGFAYTHSAINEGFRAVNDLPDVGAAASGPVRLELRERIGDRPPDGRRRLAARGRHDRGRGRADDVDFLASFRVHDARGDIWVSKEENPELWLELIPGHMRTPLRWAERDRILRCRRRLSALAAGLEPHEHEQDAADEEGGDPVLHVVVGRSGLVAGQPAGNDSPAPCSRRPRGRSARRREPRRPRRRRGVFRMPMAELTTDSVSGL